MSAAAAATEPFAFRATDRVADLLHQYPSAVSILKANGVKLQEAAYLTLGQAALQAGQAFDSWLEHLALTLPSTPCIDHDLDCSILAIDELIDYIEAAHHNYTKRELARLNFLIQRCHSHADDAAFDDLHELFEHISSHVIQHMLDEEEHLFPLGRALDHPDTERPVEHEECERNLIAIEHDHHDLRGEIERLRAACETTVWPRELTTHQQVIAEAIAHLAIDLTVHSTVEEEFLLPAIAYADELYNQRARHRRQRGHHHD